MTTAAEDPDESAQKSSWFQAPAPNTAPGDPTHPKSAAGFESAQELVEGCLAEAKEKQASGDLRGAFLACQSLVIDHYGSIPEEALAGLYGFMGKISLLQHKQERAVKYLKKARALRPDDPEIRKLFHDVVDTQDRKAPRKAPAGPAARPDPKTPPTLKTRLEPEAAPSGPATREPESPAPKTKKPESKKPESKKPESKKPESKKPESKKPETKKPETKKPETRQPVVPKPPAAPSVIPPAPAATAATGTDRRVWVAGFWTRVAAFLVDTLLVTFLVVLMTILSAVALSKPGSSFATFFQQTSTLIAFVSIFTSMLLTYLTLFSIFGGQTAGKMLLGLKVVGLDGHSLSVVQALRRAGGMLLAGLPGLAGFFWTGFDLNRRGWHDYLGRTLVVHLQDPAGKPDTAQATRAPGSTES